MDKDASKKSSESSIFRHAWLKTRRMLGFRFEEPDDTGWGDPSKKRKISPGGDRIDVGFGDPTKPPKK